MLQMKGETTINYLRNEAIYQKRSGHRRKVVEVLFVGRWVGRCSMRMSGVKACLYGP